MSQRFAVLSSFLLLSTCCSLHVAVSICINCSFQAARHICRRTYVLSGFFRPPDIHVLPVFFLSFLFHPLISKLVKRNSTKIGHVVGSKCNLKTHVRNLGYTLPYKSGAQKPPFWATSQLNGNFNGLYLRNETRYRQSVKCVDNYKVFPISCQNVMNFGPQTASNSTCIFTHSM